MNVQVLWGGFFGNPVQMSLIERPPKRLDYPTVPLREPPQFAEWLLLNHKDTASFSVKLVVNKRGT